MKIQSLKTLSGQILSWFVIDLVTAWSNLQNSLIKNDEHVTSCAQHQRTHASERLYDGRATGECHSLHCADAGSMAAIKHALCIKKTFINSYSPSEDLLRPIPDLKHKTVFRNILCQCEECCKLTWLLSIDSKVTIMAGSVNLDKSLKVRSRK